MDTSPKTPKVILLGFNELNFHFVERYAQLGSLPNFRKLIERHTVVRTISENAYPHLEPWIQWVTVHTGMTYAEHKVFRLGDIVHHDHPQIWELLANKYGISVAAISPMNARNVVSNRPDALFVPDPWTETKVSAPRDIAMLFEAVRQAVNDNAQDRITLSSAAKLAVGLVRNLRASSIRRCVQLASGAVRGKWRKALILDRILSDLFIRQVARRKYQFATIFLNAAAHVQHHYMFSSRCYEGPLRNPGWYAPAGADPVGEVYALYDEILGDILTEFPDYRILICTGLSQKPNEKLIFYYRPKDHALFLRKMGVDFAGVTPRMSRDFLISFKTHAAAESAERRLRAVVSPDGRPILEIDNRGLDLFCMLMYTDEIVKGFAVRAGEEIIEDFDQLVALVSIENGIHQTVGYLVDTGSGPYGSNFRRDEQVPLTEVFDRVLRAYEAAA